MIFHEDERSLKRLPYQNRVTFLLATLALAGLPFSWPTQAAPQDERPSKVPSLGQAFKSTVSRAKDACMKALAPAEVTTSELEADKRYFAKLPTLKFAEISRYKTYTSASLRDLAFLEEARTLFSPTVSQELLTRLQEERIPSDAGSESLPAAEVFVHREFSAQIGKMLLRGIKNFSRETYSTAKAFDSDTYATGQFERDSWLNGPAEIVYKISHNDGSLSFISIKRLTQSFDISAPKEVDTHRVQVNFYFQQPDRTVWEALFTLSSDGKKINQVGYQNDRLFADFLLDLHRRLDPEPAEIFVYPKVQESENLDGVIVGSSGPHNGK